MKKFLKKNEASSNSIVSSSKGERKRPLFVNQKGTQKLRVTPPFFLNEKGPQKKLEGNAPFCEYQKKGRFECF